MKKHYFALICFIISATSYAQIGGASVYSFLNVPASARIAALGGTFISVRDNDINSALQAPSLLNESMSKSIALSAVTYVDGVKFGDASYVKNFDKLGTFLASMHYANYGDFKETDVYGDIQGTFHASDYALNIGWGYQYNPLFSFGATIKGIYSDYYIYNAFGLAADISATYYDSLRQWTITAEAKNVGAQLKNYVKDNNEPLPAEALIAVSKRLAHTPLRFNLTYRHLEKFDMSYSDPNDLGDVDPLTGEAQVKTIGFFNKFSRHFIVGAEVLLSKNFHLRAAYNFQRRRELSIDSRPGTVGFSFGFGLKISKFILSYGRGNYHLAGGANHFSISTNLSEFIKKKS
ncbi:MAG TPA: type IX secretion system protein PorQ [Bacteroidia bacterium]|nr:type IX secretion system protein PorQ [Bacteroidia bacterium]